MKAISFGSKSLSGYYSAISVILLFIGYAGWSSSGEENVTEGGRSTAVESVLSMPAGTLLNAQTVEHIQAKLRGNEKAAVAFALENIGSSDTDTNRACVRIMAALEQETLGQYRTRIESQRGLNERYKRALGRWGRYVETPDALNLVIDNLIADTNAAEDVDMRMVGEPRRHCDIAFNLAIDRIEGLSQILGKDPLGELDNIDARDERITRFREWWKSNKRTLEWSDQRKRFVTQVNP